MGQHLLIGIIESQLLNRTDRAIQSTAGGLGIGPAVTDVKSEILGTAVSRDNAVITEIFRRYGGPARGI